jgi:hypothetical protein
VLIQTASICAATVVLETRVENPREPFTAESIPRVRDVIHKKIHASVMRLSRNRGGWEILNGGVNDRVARCLAKKARAGLLLRYEKNQNGISSAVSVGLGPSRLADVVDGIWVLVGVATGVNVSVDVEVDAAVEIGVGVGASEVEVAVGRGGFGVRMGGGGGLFTTCHFTRSRVATESSMEEWPTLAPPV